MSCSEGGNACHFEAETPTRRDKSLVPEWKQKHKNPQFMRITRKHKCLEEHTINSTYFLLTIPSQPSSNVIHLFTYSILTSHPGDR